MIESGKSLMIQTPEEQFVTRVVCSFAESTGMPVSAFLTYANSGRRKADRARYYDVVYGKAGE